MNPLKKDIDTALLALQNGEIILYPTDTIWGIGCDATNAYAIKRIFRLKQRNEAKSMIILLSHIDEISDYVSNPSPKIISYLQQQTTPTTAIFRSAIHLPKELINEDGSIAIRIVKDEFCEALIRRLQKPLVSTSANISGQPSPQNFSMIDDIIKKGVDYIVQHRQNDSRKFKPSSI
ncbi:MAG TPA: L-threonylcarbamoyladenylate synthase, partial [Chitinophagaceae bacterium]|nr:L-threonylcarbamoyladenylate synthase [Chitinophagaceae bacterium]